MKPHPPYDHCTCPQCVSFRERAKHRGEMARQSARWHAQYDSEQEPKHCNSHSLCLYGEACICGCDPCYEARKQAREDRGLAAALRVETEGRMQDAKRCFPILTLDGPPMTQSPLTKEQLKHHYEHMLVTDDPQSQAQHMTAEKRKAVREWFENSLPEKGPMSLTFNNDDDPDFPPDPQGRRLRRYFVSVTGLLGMITMGCPFEIVGDWPEDAHAISMSYDHETGCFVVIVSCEDFKVVEEGAIIPEGGPIDIRALPRKGMLTS